MMIATRLAFLVFFCVSGALMAAPPASAAGKCQDIPARVIILSNATTDVSTGATTPSALRSDGGGEYTTASIKVCSGTNDVVTPSERRTFIYVFPTPIPGSVIEATPSWVPGTHAVSGAIVVHNILYNKGSNSTFATMAGSMFTVPGDRATYRFGFKGASPDLPNAPNSEDPGRTPGDNTPLPSSPVVVYPTYPLVCGPGQMPQWRVIATSPNFPGTTLEVGTLHKPGPGKNAADVHEGQYSMPFEMVIQAMQCFAY
jgi:hypothetical protein